MPRIAWIGLGILLVGGTVWAQQYAISTVAGDWRTVLPAPAVNIALPNPSSVAVDASGNVYLTTCHFVLKVDASGLLSIAAGTWTAGYSGDGGPAASAQLGDPEHLAFDARGNLYIADLDNHRVRRVALDGTITTVAGNGSSDYSGDGGLAINAGLDPAAVAPDSAGGFYIADKTNHVIRSVAANGIISTVAGIGTSGFSGDGGAAAAARLNYPSGIAADAAGNLFIADQRNHVIRMVASTGIITTVVGTGSAGLSGDGGLATDAQLDAPGSVRLDAAGNLYIADSYNSRVRKVATNHIITTVAGSSWGGYTGDGGPATSATLSMPADAVIGADGNLYIADDGNNVVRKVAPNGIITTLAGNGAESYSGDGGPAIRAQFSEPNGVAVDGSGNLYIADSGNSAIRKLAPTGVVTRVVGNAQGDPGCSGDGGPAASATVELPEGVAFDAAGNLYIADYGCAVVRRVAAAGGTISRVAGTGTSGYSGDGGPATGAQLDWPWSVALDAGGNLYIADYWDNRVRKVATNGIISTLAGTGIAGNSGDGGPAANAQLDRPHGVAVDAAGVVYIADTANYAIRKVALDGTITTVAGKLGSPGSSGDGGPAIQARLDYPNAVAVDAAGNLYIADTWNYVIRKVSPGGIITTIGGNHTHGYSGDGGPATGAQLNWPQGLAVDSAGRVYVADTDNNAIRLLTPLTSSAVLGIAKTHAGSLTPGQTGATYSIMVGNAGTGPTNGTVTVSDALPAGLTLVSMAGTGWNCSSNTCTRGDALSPGASYPAIMVTVNVAANASTQVTNRATVSGGGAGPATASDPTTVLGPPAVPTLLSPGNGAIATTFAPTLAWDAVDGATSYEVYFGTSSSPPRVTSTTSTMYAPGRFADVATYYWRIEATNAAGATTSPTWSFTTGVPGIGSRFVPVNPCRVADTRNPVGTFGGPTMTAGSMRSFPIPQSRCNIPPSAVAYALNVTVVPKGPLGYLTLWPTGWPPPYASTLNSFGGLVVANGALVGAGADGAVSVYVSNQTDVILDINGYFDPYAGTGGYVFYAATPCRIVDTRNPAGQFGGPSMYAGQTRDFPFLLGSCGVPAWATAFSLNVTAVPATDFLAYLTTWPTGPSLPMVSTLNSWTGKVVANAALVPGGTNASLSVFVTDPANVILDLNGYFGMAGPGALAFSAVTPCRVADTRSADGPFGGPEMEARSTRSFAIPAGACNVPSTAAAYSLNVTVVPDGPLSYLTAWPTGSPQPFVSTLNSFDGTVVANAAIVPAGTNGAISVFVTNRTHVVLDINGYFAP